MSDESTYLTEQGAQELREELDNLVNVRRPALADKLREAREMGDLSENADYIDAKEQQAFLEGRIQQIEYILREATIVSEGQHTGAVHVGSRVTVVEEGAEDSEVYLIVGAAEASPAEGKVSHESPLGKALMGRSAGDTVTVEAPAGVLRFTIQSVE